MNQNNLTTVDWASIPKPSDDGKAAHLCGMTMPDVIMKNTNGEDINIASLSGITVIFVYPMTGKPDTPLPDGWDQIPGARGCTPQACAFRDLYGEMKTLGVKNLLGLSTQNTQYQKEAVQRLHLPFPMLSDSKRNFAKALNMPTMIVDGTVLLKRITLIINQAVITKVFYPVFPPDKNPLGVIAYLKKKNKKISNP